MKYLILVFLLTGCYKELKIECDKSVIVIEVGGCIFNKYAEGSCGALLSNGKKVNLDKPVKGQFVKQCRRLGDGELITSWYENESK